MGILKRYTMIVMSPTRGQVRQLKIARLWIILAMFLLVASFLLGGYGLYTHYTSEEKRQNLAALLEENRDQTQQLDSITENLEGLKNQIARLNQMDKRIRSIANLEQRHSGVKLEGMGDVNPDEGVLQSLQKDTGETWVGMIQGEGAVSGDLRGQQKDILQSLGKDLLLEQRLFTYTPSIWPTKGWLTSGFGLRQSPFTGMQEFHPGADVATRHGTRVIAPADGIIVDIGEAEAPGNFIRLDHGFGYQTYYAHLDEVFVKRGQRVKRGQLIATVGNTGRSTGPHLHYELLVKGLPVNPLHYILN
jgi:murein DD-endopeptidase MepM/ murein hydrolase activator NlpD